MVKQVQVHIDSMAFKGYGVARIQNKVVFIPYTAAGDDVLIEITEDKKRYAMGKIVQMIQPSPWRIQPPCPYFGRCGGCQWQHIDHGRQENAKGEIVNDILKRLGGLEAVPPLTVSPPARHYGYRARIQLKVKEGKLGYYQEKSHRILDIRECPVAHPIINMILSELRKSASVLSQIEEIEINVSPDEGKGILVLQSSAALNRQTENLLKEQLLKTGLVKGIVQAERGGLSTLCGDPALDFILPSTVESKKDNLTLRISPGSFSQVNPEQNQKLIQTVLQFSEVAQEETALDLYAGAGNFSLPLAMQAKKVIGVEENRTAVEDARFNSERNGIKNCDFIHASVEKVSSELIREKPDMILLDPPREGCKDILDQIIRGKPNKIVYVSCEPTTFARDLRRFSENGYTLRKLALIDMFPQTYHIEVVGMLQLN